MNLTSSYNKNIIKSNLNIIFNEKTGEKVKLNKSKCSTVSDINIKSFGANTHAGIFRNYNEDRLIILNRVPCPY